MAVSKSSRIGNNGIYKVLDTTAILWSMLLLALLAIISFFVNRFIFSENPPNELFEWIIIIIPNLLLLATAFRLKATWGGVKLDLTKRTIEFGGGGVAANDMIDYVRPSFLLQYFMRYTINLDEVSQMGMDSVTESHYNEKLGKWTYNTTFFIKLSGTFGAANVPFRSEGKCNELYTAIRQLNEMGDPIFMA